MVTGFVSGSELTKLPEECPHLNTRNSSQYKWEQKSHYCNSVSLCKYLERIDYQCPVIKYAREYEAFMCGKITEGKYYEYVITGFNTDTKLDTFSLLLKSSKREKYIEKIHVHDTEIISEVERLLEGK
jgi:hypothetical protein